MKAVKSNQRCGVRMHLTGVAMAVALACTGVAHADLQYGVQAGVGYSDNIERTPVNEQDETIVLTGVDLTWLEDRRRLNADVRLDLNYNEYLNDTAESEVTGNANGTVVFGVVPDRFTWLVQDTFGQAQQDPLAAATPTNRENINYFTTGPNLIFRMGSATALRLLGRYSLSTYENSPLDSDRTSGGFVLSRQLSGHSSLGWNGSIESVDFDDPESPDFDRKMTSLTYTLNASRTEIVAEAGYAWIERDVAVDADHSGPLLRLEISRRVSASSTLNITAGKQLTDASEALRSELSGIQGGFGGGTGSVTATADIFDNKFAGAGWQYERNRTSMGLTADWEEDRYETQPQLDRERQTYAANYGRQLGRSLNARLGASYTTEDFRTTDGESNEMRFLAALSWRLGRNVVLTLTGERLDRDSSEQVGNAVENRVFLTVGYRPVTATPR